MDCVCNFLNYILLLFYLDMIRTPWQWFGAWTLKSNRLKVSNSDAAPYQLCDLRLNTWKLSFLICKMEIIVILRLGMKIIRLLGIKYTHISLQAAHVNACM